MVIWALVQMRARARAIVSVCSLSYDVDAQARASFSSKYVDLHCGASLANALRARRPTVEEGGRRFTKKVSERHATPTIALNSHSARRQTRRRRARRWPVLVRALAAAARRGAPMRSSRMRCVAVVLGRTACAQAMDDFVREDGKTRVLVCTDLLSRGVGALRV